jgi:hypothetical protein
LAFSRGRLATNLPLLPRCPASDPCRVDLLLGKCGDRRDVPQFQFPETRQQLGKKSGSVVGTFERDTYYKNQNGTTTGEFMELDANLKVTKVVANYSR